jgi:hypothetical protein
VAASETEGQFDLLDRCIQITTGSEDGAGIRDDECTIELRQFLDRASQIGIGDVRPLRRVRRGSVDCDLPGGRERAYRTRS